MEMTLYVHDLWGIKKARIPIHPFKATTIFGANGSGKTRILNILVEYFKGEIDDGADLILEFGRDSGIDFLHSNGIDLSKDERINDAIYHYETRARNEREISSEELEGLKKWRESFECLDEYVECIRDLLKSDNIILGIAEEEPEITDEDPSTPTRVHTQFKVVEFELENDQDKQYQVMAYRIFKGRNEPIDNKIERLIYDKYQTYQLLPEMLLERIILSIMEAATKKDIIVEDIKNVNKNDDNNPISILMDCRVFNIKPDKGGGQVVYHAYPCVKRRAHERLISEIKTTNKKYPVLGSALTSLTSEIREIRGTSLYAIRSLQIDMPETSFPPVQYYGVNEGENNIELQLFMAAMELQKVLLRIAELQAEHRKLTQHLIEGSIGAELSQMGEEQIEEYKLFLAEIEEEEPSIMVRKIIERFGIDIPDPSLDMEKFSNDVMDYFAAVINSYAHQYLSESYDEMRAGIVYDKEKGFEIYVSSEKEHTETTGYFPFNQASSAEQVWAMFSLYSALTRFPSYQVSVLKEYEQEYLEEKTLLNNDTGDTWQEPFYKNAEILKSGVDGIGTFIEGVISSLRQEGGFINPEDMRVWRGILLIDEPELHLHAGSQRYLAKKIHEMCKGRMTVISSSHSHYFLDIPESILINTSRDRGPLAIQARQIERKSSQQWQAIAREMGLTMGELLLLAPRLLIVEGTNDVSFLRALYKPLLKQWGIEPLAVGGSTQMEKLLNPITTALLENFQDYGIAVLLDKPRKELFHLFDKQDSGFCKLQEEEEYNKFKLRVERYKKYAGDEVKKALVECLEIVRYLREMSGNNLGELGILNDETLVKELEQQLEIVESEDSYKDVSYRNSELFENNEEIMSILNRNPYIILTRAILREWNLQWRVLSRFDILYYLDPEEIISLYRLNDEQAMTLRGTFRKKGKKRDLVRCIKRLTKEDPTSARFIDNVCMSMANNCTLINDGRPVLNNRWEPLNEIAGFLNEVIDSIDSQVQ